MKHEVEQRKHDTLLQEVHEGALHKRDGTYALHFAQLQLQDLKGCSIQPVDLLMRQAEAFHQLNIAQGFRRGAGERRCFGDDAFLNSLDLSAEYTG